MEKEFIRNRQVTELTLIKAVDELIEEKGFEGLGINTVAVEAGVSKMSVYRYLNPLGGLIAAYISQHDYWINFDGALPDKDRLGEFIKEMFRKQIIIMRKSYTLKRLYGQELTSDNNFIKDPHEKREAKGIWLIDAVSKLSKHPQKEMVAPATTITAAISYPTLLEENCFIFNGFKLREESDWKELENGINILVDL